MEEEKLKGVKRGHPFRKDEAPFSRMSMPAFWGRNLAHCQKHYQKRKVLGPPTPNRYEAVRQRIALFIK